MRIPLVVAVALLVALPARAAGVDPARLVLKPSDVPSGYELDPAESGLRTNAVEAKEFPRSRAVFARWRRVTGYQAMYRRGGSRIEARVDVFRTAGGARSMLEFVDTEARKAGIAGQRRARADVGAAGWLYWVPGGSYTLVAWRQGPVFSGVFGHGITRARTIELARAQERRVAAALP
jgi:hypothetical protein